MVPYSGTGTTSVILEFMWMTFCLVEIQLTYNVTFISVYNTVTQQLYMLCLNDHF